MALTLRIPRELKSPNKWQGRHWRYKHRETQEWQKAIFAYGLGAGMRGRWSWGDLRLNNGLIPWERRKVTVVRIVPSRRNFIRDDDNLRFATKPLNDALKRSGLIFDDSRYWLVQGLPEQRVSPDGEWATEITIEPVEPSKALETAS